MTLGQLSSRAAVEQAVAECDRLGTDAFLARYGFHHARRYRLLHDGRSYDSKAIAGVAHGYQFPELGPLRVSAFAGGLRGAAGRLRKLGFQVVDEDNPASASAFVTGMRRPLRAAASELLPPLSGLRRGEQLGWHSQQRDPLAAAVEELGNGRFARPATEFPWGRDDLRRAGLYSWWVDDAGAEQLSVGLGHHVPAGLVYAGQAGATRQPSGLLSEATLLSRIGSNHLRGRITSSTWRRTLGSILLGQERFPRVPADWDRGSEAVLSSWMRAHLRVAVHPVGDRATVATLEQAVLQHLDPPLNLEGMRSTRTRRALTILRRRFNDLDC